MIIIKPKKCLRCGYEWYPRKPGKPVRCAKCKTPYWDKLKEVNYEGNNNRL